MGALSPEDETPPAAFVLFQMKVMLMGITPPIWRRFEVTNDVTFYDLHHILQIVMGWRNYHLYQFVVSGVELSDPVTAAKLGIGDAEKTMLSQLLLNGLTRFVYEYDFGARWEHEILVEERRLFTGQRPLPICLAGERACPPEGSGGSRGYARFLESLRERTRPMRLTEQGWVRLPFAPDVFDVNKINAALSSLRC